MKTKKFLVLLIDDDENVRMATMAALNHCGYLNIIVADSGKQGIKMIKAHHPDLVLTDLTMPGMRGEEVIWWINREYKPLFPFVKTIAVSGDDQETFEPVVVAAGGDGFLHKPFDLGDLKRLLEKVLST